MKKIAQTAFLVLTLALMVSASVTMLFIKQDGSAEKRTLAAFPRLMTEAGLNLSFPSQFEDWLNDHVGLRMFWQQQYARLNGAMGASANESVVVGKDGWLYFDSTVSDYTGVDALNENELMRVKYALELIDKLLDKPFFVMFAPNKSSVYPEYMPDRYPRAQELRASQWLNQNCSVQMIDAESALTGEGLYFRTDTHWNEKGARIAAGLIIDRLNAELGLSAVKPDPDADCEPAPYAGDLGVMLYPNDPPEDHHLVYADGGQRYEYEGRYRTQEDMTITTSGGEADVRLLMLRDSFTNALIEPLSNALGDVQYRRAMPLPLSDAEEYDAVLLEMVERRIRELLGKAPVILSEERGSWPESEITCTAAARAQSGSKGVRVYGAIDCPVSGVQEIIVSVTDGGETRYFDAFPCAESDEFAGDGAFSLLIPEMTADATVQVYMRGADGIALSGESTAEWAE